MRVMPPALRQCQQLAAAGSAVVLVTPNAESATAMGNLLDSAGRADAVGAGFAQAEAALPDVGVVWSGERRAATADPASAP
jgi:phosphotransacetylase